MKTGLQAVAEVAAEALPPPFGSFVGAAAGFIIEAIEKAGIDWSAVETRRLIIEKRNEVTAKAEAEFR